MLEYFLDDGFLKIFLQLLSLSILVLILQFFRNPNRKTKLNKNHIISPVDGKVVNIEKVFEKEYFKDERILISIFMSPLNVHVTRYPISGVINYSKYHPGEYLVAWHPKSSEKNERTTIVVENKIFNEIDVDKLKEELNYNLGFKNILEKKLSNENFVSNAPKEVIQKERKKLEDVKSKIKILEESIKKQNN